MDSITSSALEELCSSGPTGLTLPNLWPKLLPTLTTSGLDLSSGVKRAVWANLLTVPGLQFQAQNAYYNSTHSSIQSFEDAEKLNVKIVAEEHLRDCFVGIYDLKARNAGLSSPQRRALERLAIARTNGITQSQLAKEFGKEGNEIFYVVRNLECQGLIVRQPTVVRTKGACNDGELENSSAITTNMLYLYRYAKHLGSQQRLEITNRDKTLESLGNADECAASGDGGGGECVKGDVLVKDFLPSLKAICDKLEEANGKVLVVKDIKRDLGYRQSSGHRAWRNICQRLKDAHVVEEFKAKVNNKDVPCLRLLKKFSPKSFEAKTLGCGNDNFDAEQLVNVGKRGQITDQLVELPIEHQIYDMIDAEGMKGLTVIEVCKRLGISNKKYYNRLHSMFFRFGMHLQEEGHNRGKAYRVWTSGNFNPDSSHAFPSKLENVLDENGVSNPHVEDLALHEKLALTIPELGPSTSKGDVATSGKMKIREIEAEPSHGSPGDGECNNMFLCPSNLPELVHELRGTAPDAELDLVSTATESNVAPLETSPPALSKPLKPQSYQRYPCLTLTAVSAQREQRILERLQEEKFILRAELQRWLESFEKDKCTTMDSRTLIRILNKLQQQGQCKCIKVSVPVVRNCGRSRTKEVVLHPSVQNLPPELLGQIHDKLRSFDMQSRGHGVSRLKNDLAVPVLDGVQKTQNSVVSEGQAVRSEAMRANGFILAKMIRAKLLHCFLCGYLSSSPGWDDALSSGKHGYDMKNPHSTCKLFALDAAIKAIPLELFLQVVGSTQKFDDMIEKCRSGLCLSDLPVQEYKCLMDTQATGRLSLIIDILRRLKLIRLVTDGNSEDGAKVPHAIFRHAMELKPYIEEPRSIVSPSLGFGSLDLRPQIRHDFILLNREAVDEYWRTLEYCYSAADPTAALHAFPGSAVHEVFLYRSWASVRVMTADQRAELLKRILKDDPDKKLSFKECEKIAKDLNLTLQQVLRVYYDKRQQRLNRFQGVLNAEGEEFQPLKSKRDSSSRKRKRSSEAKSLKHIETVAGQLGKQRLAKLSDTGNQFTEEHFFITSSEEQDIHSQAYLEHDQSETVEEPGPNEEDEHYSFISKCAFSGMPTRQRKFSWTEKADRQLVIQYVRHRATLGANFHRTDWASLPDLPAPPSVCKRRMALLNSNIKFRKAVMKLCNMLSERYAKHLDKTQNRLLNHDDHRLMVRDSLGEGLNRDFSDGVKHIQESGYEEEWWDDFDNYNIKMALDEVLQYKRMAKLEASRKVRSVPEELSDLYMDAEGYDPQESELVLSTTLSEDIQNPGGRQRKDSGQRSSCHRLPRKFIKLLSEGKTVGRRAYESLAVSNAVELFKLVFLSTSRAPEVPNLLAETLRRYSEHDLFAAFSYLREKKIMVGGNGSNSFALSQQFLQSISSSPFPTNTGKRAAKFDSWLHEREKDLMEEGINLTGDLQCGDIFQLFSLVSLGELSIKPCLPDEGVGDAEDLRSLKRKAGNTEFCIDDKAKKLKSSLATEGEIISRREKGFPGIMVSLSRATFSRANAIELFKDGKICTGSHLFDKNDQFNTTLGQKIDSSSSHSDHLKENLNFGSIIPIAGVSNESPWEAMTSYAEHLMSIPSDREQVSPFYPDLFRTVCTAIQKAGDQGLSMEQVSQVMDIQGEKMPELIVEVLQAFGRALKVNAYKSVHVVDALYRSKYFLTSMAGFCQELKSAPSTKSQGINDDGHLILQPDNHEIDGANSQREISMKIDNVHKVTILNLPEVVSPPSNKIQTSNELEGCMQGKVVFPEGDHGSKSSELSSGDSRSFRPILPWINGDGTINRIVCKGLTRRVLGTVMQNPGILERRYGTSRDCGQGCSPAGNLDIPVGMPPALPRLSLVPSVNNPVKEDDIIRRMDVLNPQSCRKLLELMILDNHLIVRKMHQTTSSEPPAILGSLLGNSFKKSKSICREHFFANPMSTSLL